MILTNYIKIFSNFEKIMIFLKDLENPWLSRNFSKNIHFYLYFINNFWEILIFVEFFFKISIFFLKNHDILDGRNIFFKI